MIEALKEKETENKKARILIIDDEPQNLRLVEVKLRRDYEIVMVESGKKAINILRSGEQFDLILLDQMMPEMDGVMTYAEMQEQKLIEDVPVIMATAHGSVKLATAFMKMGGTNFVEKPIIDPDALKLKIRQALDMAEIIKEQRRMEEEFVKIQKLESVGTLAGGIAHDFNNFLTGILGNISLAKMYIGSEDKVIERLTEAEKASLRARDLTQQLLTFSKGGVPIRKMCSIAQMLEELVVFALRGSNVRCELSIQGDLWTTSVDSGQIGQVINNIIINADQAMPEGGIIKVQAENVTSETEHTLALRDENYVKITIQDQGAGIPEEHLQKIFDPYFTTKQKGHGLGLAISYSIIKKHNGYINIESSMGIGTTFYIHLPAFPGQNVEKETKLKEELIMGEGRILVMDDEETIRNIASEMLKDIGYEAVVAVDGVEAIKLYMDARESKKTFDVIIMDLTIPGGLGGKETIQKLLEIDPEVKAIVSSGYSSDPIMANFKKYGFSGFIAKPYEIKQLSETLHKVTTT